MLSIFGLNFATKINRDRNFNTFHLSSDSDSVNKKPISDSCSVASIWFAVPNERRKMFGQVSIKIDAKLIDSRNSKQVEYRLNSYFVLEDLQNIVKNILKSILQRFPIEFHFERCFSLILGRKIFKFCRLIRRLFNLN